MSVMTEVRRATARWQEAGKGPSAPSGGIFEEIVAVEEVCPPSAVYAPGPLPFLILYRTLQGRADVRVEDQGFAHHPGSLVVVAPNCALVETVGAEEPWHLRYVLLRGAWARQMGTHLHQRPLPVLLAPPTTRSRQLFSELFDLTLTQPGGWQWRFTSRAAELLGMLFEDAQTQTPGDALAGRVGQLMDRDPAQRLTPEQIARAVQLSERQLTYEFRKATGEPLAQWIRRRRIVQARRLLGQGQSVSDVSEQLGFATPSHFSRVFKAVTGVPPSAVCEEARRTSLHF